MTSNIDYIDKIPNNVDLGRDRVLQRALEHWQPAYMGWWFDMGPTESHNYDVYLRTAADAATSEIIRQLGEGNRVLGIGGDFAYENRAFHRFFVTHDEHIRHSEGAGGVHLVADLVVAEAMMDGDSGVAQAFHDGE